MIEVAPYLILFILITIAFYFSISQKIDKGLTIILLTFSIVLFIVMNNVKVIDKLKWGVFEVQTAKSEISKAKEKAIDEINTEVKRQKKSIKFLIFNANNTKEKIENQRKNLEKTIKIAKELQKNINDQKIKIMALNKYTDETKKNLDILNIAQTKIALILVRATYFSIETKGEFGTPRAIKAINEILKDLNQVLPMIIPEEKERIEWVEQLKKTL